VKKEKGCGRSGRFSGRDCGQFLERPKHQRRPAVLQRHRQRARAVVFREGLRKIYASSSRTSPSGLNLEEICDRTRKRRQLNHRAKEALASLGLHGWPAADTFPVLAEYDFARRIFTAGSMALCATSKKDERKKNNVARDTVNNKKKGFSRSGYAFDSQNISKEWPSAPLKRAQQKNSALSLLCL